MGHEIFWLNAKVTTAPKKCALYLPTTWVPVGQQNKQTLISCLNTFKLLDIYFFKKERKYKMKRNKTVCMCVEETILSSVELAGHSMRISMCGWGEHKVHSKLHKLMQAQNHLQSALYYTCFHQNLMIFLMIISHHLSYLNIKLFKQSREFWFLI